MSSQEFVKNPSLVISAVLLLILLGRLLASGLCLYLQTRQGALQNGENDDLRAPLLAVEEDEEGEEACGDQSDKKTAIYRVRHTMLRWTREVMGLLLGAIYAVHGASVLKSKPDAGIKGTTVLLVAAGWICLSQMEEMPSLYNPTSPPWLTLMVGYFLYLAIAVHSIVIALIDNDQDSTGVMISIKGLQVLLAIIVFILLMVELILDVKASRAAGAGGHRRSSAARKRFSCLKLFDELKIPATPEQSASLLSTCFFWWINPILVLGKTKVLALDDLYHVEEEDLSSGIWTRFRPQLIKMLKAHGYGSKRHNQSSNTNMRIGSGLLIVWALLATWPMTFASMGIYLFISTVAEFGVPVSLKYLVDFIANHQKGEPIPNMAYASASTLFLAPALAAVCNAQQYQHARRLIFQWRAALIGLTLRQTLRIDPSVASYSSGQVINLCSVDASNADALRYFHFAWSVPLEVILSISLIFWVLKSWISGLVGVVLMAGGVYVTVKVSERLRQAQKAMMTRKDVRLSLLGEGLSGIRILKLLAWERDFLVKLEKARQSELVSLRSFIIIRCLVSVIWTSTPILVSGFTFLLHIMILKKPLTASQGYAALALFAILRDPLSSLNTYINNFVKAQVSFSRIERFVFQAALLQCFEGRLLTDDDEEEDEEADGDRNTVFTSFESLLQNQKPSQRQQRCPPGMQPGEVIVRGATFTWREQTDDDGDSEGAFSSASRRATLSGLDLHVKPGELVCVYGSTGGGKSSMLMAILGEMRTINSTIGVAQHKTVACCGSVAYTAQRAWIMNGTVRENILFGMPMDPARYEATLEACALRPDLQMLEGGDLTEIGEKGVTLSGGQQQRLSLARAVYHEAIVLLLDDVLSAVDPHVARYLMENCLTGPLMTGRTRLLVTHQVALTLPFADQLVVINEDGHVALQGNPKDPKASEAMKAFLKQHAEEGGGSEGRSENTFLPRAMSSNKLHNAAGGGDRAIAEEAVIKKGGTLVAAPMARADGEGKQLIKAEAKAEGCVKLRVYTSYMAAGGGILLALPALATFGAAEALNYFQNKALGDWVTHIETKGDQQTSPSSDTRGVLIYIFFSAGSMGVAILQAILMSWSSLTASRRIHRDMARRVLRAPMSWFERTPMGRVQNRFSSDMETIDQDLMDTLTKFINRLAVILTITAVILHAMAPLVLGMIPILMASAYVGYTYQKTSRELKRLESVTRSPIYSHFSETVAGVATVRAYQRNRAFVAESNRRVDANDRVYHHLWSANRWLAVRLQLLGSVITGMVGVYIMCTLGSVPGQTAGLVLLFCMNFSDNMNSLIRQQAEVEMDFNSVERCAVEYGRGIIQEKEAINPQVRPPSSAWPSQGEVVVRDLRVRYPGTETDVIKGLTFRIPPKTRIGIVGRTGAGKSSIISSLFRLVEPQEGSMILIDGQDTQKLGLDDLRSRLAICPQEPVLFTGTVRSNLDPYDEYHDQQIWQALEKAQLRGNVVHSLQDNITEGGSNYSVGQRALLCMSRALLRMRAILVMDEATANVDHATDAAIQNMVRTQLKDCTIICVAHRLRTVAFYDAVLVLDSGVLMEYDTPLALLKKEDSIFRAMALQTGEFEVLLNIAKEASAMSAERRRENGNVD